MNFLVVKTIDNLGRIVLPKNMRDYYGILLNGKVKLIATDEGVLITKFGDVNNEENTDRSIISVKNCTNSESLAND